MWLHEYALYTMYLVYAMYTFSEYRLLLHVGVDFIPFYAVGVLL